SGAARDTAKHLVERFAADVVEVHVDAVWRVPAKLGAQVSALVVDRGVEPELLNQPGALLGPARDPHGAAALDAGDLPDHAAHRAGRARHDDGLPRLGPPEVEQTEVSREPGHPEHAEMDRRGRERSVDGAYGATVRERVALHPEHPGHEPAG